jgi:hypothetical protein
MFQNRLRQQQSNDPFDNMGKIEERQEIEDKNNPFDRDETGEATDPGTHFVDPHYVQDHTRSDGTHVDGYWRDGDGNTHHDQTIEEGGGYDRTNPDGDLTNNLGFNT